VPADFLDMVMQLLIFTDIDGSLLDFDSYQPGPVLQALEACRRAEVPVILSTSKPAVEVFDLRKTLLIDTPFIVENGAAVLFPGGSSLAQSACDLAKLRGWKQSVRTMQDGERFIQLEFGVDRALIIESLSKIADGLGISVRGLSEMSVDEIIKLTGLPVDQATAANLREFTEPFLVMGESGSLSGDQREALLQPIGKTAELLDLTCTMGGRFFHLQGRHTKGSTVSHTIECYTGDKIRQFETMALGDAGNDLEMLASVDKPILIRRPDGSYADHVELPGLIRSGEIGPQGWYEAVMDAIDSLV